MKLVAIALSAWLLAFQCMAYASPYTDKKTFEEAAKQEILQGQSSRENIQFRGLVATEFDDSLNLCGEINRTGEQEWLHFIKIFDKETAHFNAIWVDPGEPLSEVDEFKKDQFDTYWDRRCVVR